MNPALPAGHLSRFGAFYHPVLREHQCACGAAFTGPPNAKRCAECRGPRRKVMRRRSYVRQMRSKA